MNKLKQPSSHELARASYGQEPYGVAADVGVWERFEAVVAHDVKYLLTYVLGPSAVNALNEAEYPYAFRKALPTKTIEIIECAKRDGLPKWLARYSVPAGSGYWIHQGARGQWITSEVDERNFKYDHEFQSKWEAEKFVIDFYTKWTAKYWVDTYAP